ncbi:hypothetical protein H1R20_g1313, partial [Candolleomyces eurysporus]
MGVAWPNTPQDAFLQKCLPGWLEEKKAGRGGPALQSITDNFFTIWHTEDVEVRERAEERAAKGLPPLPEVPLKEHAQIKWWYYNWSSDGESTENTSGDAKQGRSSTSAAKTKTAKTNTSLKKIAAKPLVINFGSNATRTQTEYQLYSQDHYAERVKPKVDAELACEPTAKRVAVMARVLREVFESKPEELRMEYVAKKEALQKKRKDTTKLLQQVVAGEATEEKGPEEIARIIEAMPDLLECFFEALAPMTGWNFSVIAGGPNPLGINGAISTVSYHAGQRVNGMVFKSWMPQFYESLILPFSSFCHLAYPKDVRLRRAINIMASNLKDQGALTRSGRGAGKLVFIEKTSEELVEESEEGGVFGVENSGEETPKNEPNGPGGETQSGQILGGLPSDGNNNGPSPYSFDPGMEVSGAEVEMGWIGAGTAEKEWGIATGHGKSSSSGLQRRTPLDDLYSDDLTEPDLNPPFLPQAAQHELQSTSLLDGSTPAFIPIATGMAPVPNVTSKQPTPPGAYSVPSTVDSVVLPPATMAPPTNPDLYNIAGEVDVNGATRGTREAIVASFPVIGLGKEMVFQREGVPKGDGGEVGRLEEPSGKRKVADGGTDGVGEGRGGREKRARKATHEVGPWLDLAVTYLSQGLDDGKWKDLVSLWKSFELSCVVDQPLSRRSGSVRPKELAKWVSNARKWTLTPTLEDVNVFC